MFSYGAQNRLSTFFGKTPVLRLPVGRLPHSNPTGQRALAAADAGDFHASITPADEDRLLKRRHSVSIRRHPDLRFGAFEDAGIRRAILVPPVI